METTAFIEAHRALVPFLIGRYFKAATPADAEELTSAGLVGLWRAARTYHPGKGATASTYAARCAVNRMRQEWKQLTRQARLNPLSLDAPVGDVEAITRGDNVSLRAAGPEDACLARETSAALWGLVDALPDLYRDVVRLHYGEGLTQPEVGARLGLPVEIVHSRLATARAKLRRMLTG